MRAPGRFRRWMFPLLLSATVLPPGVGTARGGVGTCYVATIREPFVIEEGGVYAAGRLRICESARISPVETLHVIYVDGMPEGAFRARAITTGDRSMIDGSSVFVFSRDSSGRLLLDGYAFRDGHEEKTFVIGMPRKRGQLTTPPPVIIAARKNN